MKQFFLLIALMAASSIAIADQIGTLVDNLANSHGWKNGGFPKLDTPRGAPTKDVIAAYCKMTSFQDASRIREFAVVEERTVKIPGPLPDSYAAARCKTDHGMMIFLLQYDEKLGRWWVMRYDVPAKKDVAPNDRQTPPPKIHPPINAG